MRWSLRRLINVKIAAVFVFLLTVLFFILATIAAFLFFSKHWAENDDEVEYYDYKFMKYSPGRNDTTSGFVTISSKIEEDEFITYVDEYGNHILISNFESEEFRCTGSCICVDSKRRVSGSIPLFSKLLYFVAALSSVVAVDLARRHFKEECENIETSGTCDRVVADIYCDREELLGKIRDEEEEGNTELGEKDRRQFMCQGHCVNRHPQYEVERALLFDHLELFDSDKQIVKRNIDYITPSFEAFDCTKLYLKQEIVLDHLIAPITVYEGMHTARYVFLRSHLRPFCEERSRAKVEMYGRKGKTLFEEESEVTEINISFCREHKELENVSVRCVWSHSDQPDRVWLTKIPSHY